MTVSPQRHVGQLLQEFVPEGEKGSPQRSARMALNGLLQAMVAKHPRPDAPTSVKECVEVAGALAAQDNLGFVFEYDRRLLDAELGGVTT
jgi:hypothetical protein